jgi:hypothetical protein
MKKCCGVCIYWNYLGYEKGLEDDQGLCVYKDIITRQYEKCDAFEIDTLLLAEN